MIRPDFSALAAKNIKEAKLDNVEAIAADVLAAEGTYDVIHLDLQIATEHVAFAYDHLRAGYTLPAIRRFWNRWPLSSMRHRLGSPRFIPTSA